MKWFSWKLALLAVPLAMILVTRVPLLTSEASYLDGDEALTGIMVLHLLEGREFPFLTYGASFGLALVEVLCSAALAAVFGLSVLTLQAAVLLLFALGACCLVLAIRRLQGNAAALIAGILISTTPAWLHLSISAWQYYQSAFLACSAAVLVVSGLLTKRAPVRSRTWWILGFCSSLAFFTQPIFALALLPLLGLAVAQRGNWRGTAILTASFLISSVAFVSVRGLEQQYWSPNLINPHVLVSLHALPRRLWETCTGTYYLDSWIPSGPITSTMTHLWIIFFLFAAASAVINALSTRRITFGVTCLASIAIVAGFSLIINPEYFGFRHLLAMVGFQAMLIAIEAARYLERPTARFASVGTCVLLISLSAASSFLEVRHVSFSGSPIQRAAPERQDIAALVSHLEAKDIKHVYTWAPMFQWKVLFASRTRVQARWAYPRDRYPAFPMAVDKAFLSGAPVAIVGEAHDTEKLQSNLHQWGFAGVAVELVAGRYTVIEKPPAKLLRRFFQLNKPDAF